MEVDGCAFQAVVHALATLDAFVPLVPCLGKLLFCEEEAAGSSAF
jgi:hypothetical protein